MWTQAEIVAAYLVEGRIAEVQAHRARAGAKQKEDIDPFESEDDR